MNEIQAVPQDAGDPDISVEIPLLLQVTLFVPVFAVMVFFLQRLLSRRNGPPST